MLAKTILRGRSNSIIGFLSNQFSVLAPKSNRCVHIHLDNSRIRKSFQNKYNNMYNFNFTSTRASSSGDNKRDDDDDDDDFNEDEDSDDNSFSKRADAFDMPDTLFSILSPKVEEEVVEVTSTFVPTKSNRPLKGPDKFGRHYATGRRKTAVARVWIKEGSGEFEVNDKQFIQYFQSSERRHVLESFLHSGTAGFFNVWCTVKGGGKSGQAGAVRLGISRALEQAIPTLRPALRQAGLLTRDARRVERKKPGQKKARKKFQWVKR